MKNTVFSALTILLLALTASAQKTNDAIAKQIKSLKADKSITLTYDEASNASKIFVRADNFSEAEAKKAGIQWMNFAMAYNYPDKDLDASPDYFELSF